MSNLSPAAIALEADLCLLTRLPLPKEADLDAIKERVFGSAEGVPRTEDESRRRYVDAIVQAFDAAGVYRIEQLPEEVRRLVKKVGTVSAERDRLMAALHKLEDSYGTRTRERDEAIANARRLQAIIDEQGTEHEDVSDDLRKVREEYDALREKYEALNGEHKDLVIVRRRLIDVESEGNHLRIENAKLRDAAHALTTERDHLAARVREHEETLAVLSNVNAELFKTQQEQSALSAKHDRLVEDYEGLKRVYHSICEELNDYREKCAALKKERDGLRAELKKAQEHYDALKTERATDKDVLAQKDKLMRDLNEALDRARNRVQEIQAETVEQENSYNHLALVVVDLLKGRGVE